MNQNKLTRVSEIINREIEKKKLHDASILVLQKDQEEFFGAYGDVKRDTIFEIFSMTKPITAAAVMILMERGEIDLYEPIAKYLPEFSDMNVMTKNGKLVDAKSPITIQHCLNMTSGLVYPGNANPCEEILTEHIAKVKEKLNKEGAISSRDVTKAIAKTPLLFQPGKRWHYCISADVLGVLVSVVTGKKLSEFVQEEIFTPLGMKDTGFSVPKEKQSRLAQMYMTDAKTGNVVKASEQKLVDLVRHGITDEVPFEAGGSGLYSTIDDYAAFAQMLLHEGEWNGVRILGRKTAAYMRENQMTEKQRATIDFDQIYGYGYGNLMRTMVDKTYAASNGSIGEYGWDGLPGTYFCVDPMEQLVIVYMQQIAEGQDLHFRHKLRNVIYGAIQE